MKRFIALLREVFGKVNSAPSSMLLTGFLLLSLYFAGCAGQLGKIEASEVETVLMRAESAIEEARAADAPSLVSDAFEAAVSNLEEARTAFAEKNGIDALRLAHQAIVDARGARQRAVNITKNSELNAIILEKEAGAKALRQTFNTKAEHLAKVQTELQQLTREKKDLKQTISNLEKEKRELWNKQETYGEQVAELSETLKGIQSRAKRAETNLRNYGKEMAELRHKLEVADVMVREEGHQKRAAIAQAESLREQMREQAQIYTERLEQANKRGAVEKHGDYLKQKAQEARAYVQSQQANQPVKTGRTSLSTEQIAAGKTALSNWNNAWQGKNLTVHLGYYTPNVVADKVVIRESKEYRSKIDLYQLEVDLRQMNAHPWRKVKTDTQVEGESVIGVHRLSRLVRPAEDENATALYNIWIREVWMHQVGNEWKIHSETWQIYENVPNL